AGPAHRDAHAGLRQRRRIVDTIADHSDGAMPFLKFFHRRHFGLREQVRPYLIDADLLAERATDRLVVASQHDHWVDAERTEVIEDGLDVGPRLIGNAKESKPGVIALHYDDTATLFLKTISNVADVRRDGYPRLFEETQAADRDRLTRHTCSNPATGDTLD